MSDARYGLNIGTQTIGISSIGSKEILVEKNAIAIRDEKYVIGYGNDAYEMFERTPENVEVVFPVKMGVISDLNKMQMILENLYKKLNRAKMIRGTEFLIAVPTDTTEVEKRAFHELVANSKIRPRNISVVEKSIADSIACGINPKSPKGNILVNIGADTTDISVISLGGIVMCKTINIAGNRFNELIVNAVRAKHEVLIGMKTAEALKISLVNFDLDAPDREMTVFGRVISTGLPRRISISSRLVTDAITEQIRIIIEDTKRVLEKTPPELASDITEEGIYLLGGSACLNNLDELFARETRLRINVADDPANSTIRGVTKIFGNSKYDSLRYYPEEKEYN